MLNAVADNLAYRLDSIQHEFEILNDLLENEIELSRTVNIPDY